MGAACLNLLLDAIIGLFQRIVPRLLIGVLDQEHRYSNLELRHLYRTGTIRVESLENFASVF